MYVKVEGLMNKERCPTFRQNADNIVQRIQIEGLPIQLYTIAQAVRTQRDGDCTSCTVCLVSNVEGVDTHVQEIQWLE